MNARENTEKDITNTKTELRKDDENTDTILAAAESLFIFLDKADEEHNGKR